MAYIYVMSIVRVPCVYPDAVRTSKWLRSGRVKAEASKTFRPASRKAWRGAVSFTCTYTRVSNADLSHDGDAVAHKGPFDAPRRRPQRGWWWSSNTRRPGWWPSGSWQPIQGPAAAPPWLLFQLIARQSGDASGGVKHIHTIENTHSIVFHSPVLRRRMSGRSCSRRKEPDRICVDLDKYMLVDRGVQTECMQARDAPCRNPAAVSFQWCGPLHPPGGQPSASCRTRKE